MTSRMTGPRRLPMWTVPEGVFESLTTWGPSTLAASSSAQSTVHAPLPPRVPGRRLGGGLLADLDDGVREVARGHLHAHLVALLATQQRATHWGLVADLALDRFRLGRPDDGERLLPLVAVDLDG